MYILIEPIASPKDILEALLAQEASRKGFRIVSKFSRQEGLQPTAQSVFQFNSGQSLAVFHAEPDSQPQEEFTQEVAPSIRLMIVGTEHDTVALTQIAAGIGFQVAVVAPPDDPKSLANFPGASHYYPWTPEQLKVADIDGRTAVVLMTHSFSKDLKYLGSLIGSDAAYVGLLGPKKRREKLFDALIEHYPEVATAFIENLHGPAGINIGAETAYEIGVSIVAEILACMRGQHPQPLKDKTTGIHD